MKISNSRSQRTDYILHDSILDSSRPEDGGRWAQNSIRCSINAISKECRQGDGHDGPSCEKEKGEIMPLDMAIRSSCRDPTHGTTRKEMYRSFLAQSGESEKEQADGQRKILTQRQLIHECHIGLQSSQKIRGVWSSSTAPTSGSITSTRPPRDSPTQSASPRSTLKAQSSFQDLRCTSAPESHMSSFSGARMLSLKRVSFSSHQLKMRIQRE